MATRALAVRAPARTRTRTIVRTRTRRLMVRGRPRKKKVTIPVAVVLGFAPGAKRIWDRRGNVTEAMNEGASIYTGYTNGQFVASQLRLGLYPLLAGFAVHMAASKFGLNRMLANAGIPFIRI